MDDNNITLQAGDAVHISGHSAELWIDGYNTDVDSYATVVETPWPCDKKVTLSIAKIGPDLNVIAGVRRDKIIKI